MDQPTDRRGFLVALATAVGAALVLRPVRLDALAASALTSRSVHPDPRPDVDGSKVLTAEQLRDVPDAVDVFDGIREIPKVADGVFCYCGCDGLPEHRSLLSCFEGAAMAKYCQICQGEGRLVVRRHAEGQSLDQIRRAIDARFGRGGDTRRHRRHPLAAPGGPETP